MKGKIYDNISKNSISDAVIKNIHKGIIEKADSNGFFSIPIDNDELVQFEALGYQVARIRINEYFNPIFYEIGLIKILEPPVIDNSHDNFYTDSLYWARKYARELNFPKMSMSDMMYRPWDLFSKTNKAKWHLQATFQQYIQDKYIDEHFNESLIKEYSPLEGEWLKQFMVYYRPSYQFLRSLTQYEYLSWLKNTAYQFYMMKKNMDVQQQ